VWYSRILSLYLIYEHPSFAPPDSLAVVQDITTTLLHDTSVTRMPSIMHCKEDNLSDFICKILTDMHGGVIKNAYFLIQFYISIPELV
jgi:hypothetical protein